MKFPNIMINKWNELSAQKKFPQELRKHQTTLKGEFMIFIASPTSPGAPMTAWSMPQAYRISCVCSLGSLSAQPTVLHLQPPHPRRQKHRHQSLSPSRNPNQNPNQGPSRNPIQSPSRNPSQNQSHSQSPNPFLSRSQWIL